MSINLSPDFKKVLVLKLRSLGDTVLLTAPLIQLARLLPGAEIHVVVTEEWTSILKGLPGITRVWPYHRPRKKLARASQLSQLAFQLRKENYDCVLNLHASASSALLALSTGAKVRSIHFHGHRSRNYFSTVKVPGKGVLKPIIERDMDTLRALGVEVPLGAMPQIIHETSELEYADDYLARLKIEAPILGLNLGASRPTKQWPLSRFAALSILWATQEKGGVLAFAGPQEADLVRAFESAVDEQLSQANHSDTQKNQTRNQIQSVRIPDLRSLSAIVSRLNVFAGNDSGPKHIAVAVNTPTVTLFGPEHPFEWHPYPTTSHPYFFVDGLKCRSDADPKMPAWCGISKCETEQHKCMKRIEVDSVFNECRRIARPKWARLESEK
jgi:ADP-heptose:LPS heptosyltransferase